MLARRATDAAWSAGDDDEESAPSLGRSAASAAVAAGQLRHPLPLLPASAVTWWRALTVHPRRLLRHCGLAAVVLLGALAIHYNISFLYSTEGVEVSTFTRRVHSAVAGTSSLPGGIELSWDPRVASAGWPAAVSMHDVTADIVAGRSKLSLAVLVLSCARAACAEPRSAARRAVYDVAAWSDSAAGGAADGFTYCANTSAPLQTVPWSAFWAAVTPPRVLFIVGAEGLTPDEAAAVAAERRAHGDVLLLPSGDSYGDLHEKVLQALAALADVAPHPPGEANLASAASRAARPLEYTAVMKTDADSLVRLPQLLWALRMLLPTAVDVGDGGRYTDVAWGRWMAMPGYGLHRWGVHTRPPADADFVGGMGYVLTAGLANSIVNQLRAAPAAQARSAGGVVPAGGSAEDLGMSLMLLTRPHTQVNDLDRFHDVDARRAGGGGGGGNQGPSTPTSLVIHGLKSARALQDAAGAMSEAALRAVPGLTCSSALL